MREETESRMPQSSALRNHRMEKGRKGIREQAIRRRVRRIIVFGALLGICLGLCYLFVWERVYTLELADQYSQTRKNVHDLKEKCRTLEYDINQLSSMKRIAEVARRDLALIPQQEAQLASFTITAPKTTAPVKADSIKSKPTSPKSVKTNPQQKPVLKPQKKGTR